MLLATISGQIKENVLIQAANIIKSKFEYPEVHSTQTIVGPILLQCAGLDN